MPLAELGDYAGKLRSLSGGGGTFETSDAGWGDVDVTTVRKREEAFLGVD
jgi:translation elongation factor EF-G